MNGRGRGGFRGKSARPQEDRNKGERPAGRGGFKRSMSSGGKPPRGGGDRRNDRNQRGGNLAKRLPKPFDNAPANKHAGARPPGRDRRPPKEAPEADNSEQFQAKNKALNPQGNNKKNLTELTEKILSKSTAGEERQKLIERSVLIIDEYGVEAVITKNSGSRLIQSILKYGNTESKELIFLKIMKSNLEKILTDNFGKYIVKKILVHMKDKKLIQIFQSYIDTNFDLLLANVNGKIALCEYLEGLPEYKALEMLKNRVGKKMVNEQTVTEKVKEIIDNKSFGNTIDQFWLYHNWHHIPEDSKLLVTEQVKENLDSLIETKLNGILLYCKVFDFVELKEKTKMLKKCLNKKLQELFNKNPNILFLLVKVINSYDDSVNITNIVYNDILANLYWFVENQTTSTFLFYVLCEDFEKEFSAKFHPTLVQMISADLMNNSGKKPINKKLEEARIKLFNNDSFAELIKPDFISKLFDSTFLCVLMSMILSHFVKSETCKESIAAFDNLVLQNTKEVIETGVSEEINKLLLISHPFTHRMVTFLFLRSRSRSTSSPSLPPTLSSRTSWSPCLKTSFASWSRTCRCCSKRGVCSSSSRCVKTLHLLLG